MIIRPRLLFSRTEITIGACEHNGRGIIIVLSVSLPYPPPSSIFPDGCPTISQTYDYIFPNRGNFCLHICLSVWKDWTVFLYVTQIRLTLLLFVDEEKITQGI